jgi:hypothetical protein
VVELQEVREIEPNTGNGSVAVWLASLTTKFHNKQTICRGLSKGYETADGAAFSAGTTVFQKN